MKKESRKERVKRYFVWLVAAFILSGYGAAARESGFYEHNAMYRNWDHFMFSAYGYKQNNPQKAQQSKDQEWWGVNVEESVK